MRVKPVTLFYVTICLLLLFWAYYGARAWFFPSDNFSFISYIVIQAMTIHIVLRTYKKLPKKVKTKYVTIRKSTSCIVAVMVIPFASWLPISVGLPATVTLLYKPNDKIVTSIDYLMKSSKGCSNRIGFEDFSVLSKDYICVNEKVINLYSKGETVELVVNKSFLGVRLFSIKKHG